MLPDCKVNTYVVRQLNGSAFGNFFIGWEGVAEQALGGIISLDFGIVVEDKPSCTIHNNYKRTRARWMYHNL